MRSSSGCGPGWRSTEASSWASSAGSAPPSTTAASASRWTSRTSARCCDSSSTSTGAAGSTGTTGWSTGARAAPPRSPTSRSSTSSVDDTLTYARYPLADGGGSITVATVRPATILADVAVAVHPADERYRHLVGREAIVPVVERRVPVIADDRVEPGFGTGALKITPGHDPRRLRDRPAPRSRRADGGRARRSHERGGLRLRGPDPGGGGSPRARLARGAGPARAPRVLPPRGRPLRALSHAGRAADLAPVVLRDDGARGARDRGRPRRHRALPPARPRQGLPRLDGGDPALVHLASALVGTSDPRLVLRLRRHDRRRERARSVRRVRRPRAAPRRRRPRHVVLLGALAVRHARLAGRHRRRARVLPGPRQLDRARDHLPLGRPDDHGRARADGRRAVPRRDHPLDRARARRAAGCRRASAPASTRWT